MTSQQQQDGFLYNTENGQMKSTKMFSPTGRSSGTCSLTGLDMWDNESYFRAQASAWCGMSASSDSGFLPIVSGRHRDPRLRKWQSSHLLSELGPGLFSPPGVDLMDARAKSSLRQAGVRQWLQDAHKHLDSHLDQLKTKDQKLNCNIRHAELLDTSHRRGDPVLSELKQRLKDAEEKAMTLEEERNNAQQLLKTSTENQKAAKTQIQEMNRRVSYTMQHRSEIQEQLREANNKISQACLDKAKLLTQVSKLENHVKELELKLTEALLDNKHLIKEKEGFSQKVQALERQQVEDHDAKSPSPMALIEVNEKLNKELEINKHSLKELQNQLQALQEESINHIKRKAALETERFQMIRENKEPLLRNDQYKPSELSETSKKSQQHREELELENQRLWDQCLFLQTDVQEKEKMLHLQEERHHKQDLESVQAIEELRAIILHWTKKWQKVAQSLQSTQEELDKIRSNSKHELPARVPEDCHDDGNLEEDGLVDWPLRNQQDDNQRKMDQLEIQKTFVAQDLQTLKKVKDEKPSVEDKMCRPVCLVTDQQRRMVNEQLKSLFKEQEEKQAGKVNTLPAAVPAESCSSQERIPISKPVWAATDRRNWHSASGLMPVMEEDEESCDPPEEFEGEPVEKVDKTFFDQRQQKSSAPGMAVWDLLSAKSLTCLDDSKKTWIWSPPPYPDGIFAAKTVDICSPDEGDGEGDVM